MAISTWTAAGLLAFAVVVTIFANWMVARVVGSSQMPTSAQSGASPEGKRAPRRARLASTSWVVAASVVWVAVMWMAGVVAARYIERTSYALVGYGLFGAAALALSGVRAWLFRRSRKEPWQGPPREPAERAAWAWRHLAHPLFALVVYLAPASLLGARVHPAYLIPVFAGALLPDLDSARSPAGALMPFLARRLEACLGHLGTWHSLGINVGVVLVTLPLILVFGMPIWALVGLGFLSHLTLDLFGEQGIPLWWPFSAARLRILGGPLGAEGSPAHARLTLGLLLAGAVVLSAADLGPSPAPVAPTYEQSLQRYYALRGRNLVFADVEGTWQATTRRITGRFEILNARGESLILLDRYSGQVFTAGRSPADSLYLNRLSIAPGAQARVKPMEIHLRNQALAEVLPVLYEMHAEPGLQHIYAFGDLKLAPRSDAEPMRAEMGSVFTELRGFVSEDGQHYRLEYLTASDLVSVASIEVEVASLVIVATYSEPPSGPTPTPLPRPAFEAESVQGDQGAP